VRQKRRGILSAGGLRVCDCNSLESLFDKEGLRGLTQANAMTVQRNAAGVWGVPRIPFSPQEWGG
jgi:hypothetical protein